MKRILTISAAVLLALLIFAACGKSPEQGSTPQQQTQATADSVKPTAVSGNDDPGAYTGELTEIDLFSGLQIVFDGWNETDITPEFITDGCDERFRSSISFSLDEDYSTIKNGDKITIRVTYDEQVLNSYMCKSANDTCRFEVSGLTEIWEAKPFSDDVAWVKVYKPGNGGFFGWSCCDKSGKILFILESGSEMTYMNSRNPNPFQIAIQEGLPVKSIYIGLKEGIQFGFPWRNIYRPGFDPRKRPWYIRGKDSDRPVWGKPYVGSDYNVGLCLPCSVSIQDMKGDFYGVVGLDMTFNKLADILHHTGNVGFFVLDSALIDSHGRIIASSEKKKHQATYSQQDSEKNAEVAMVFFATPKIRRTILAQKFGFFSDFEPGRGEVLYLYAQMKTLNWIFVQKIDFEAFRIFFRRHELMKKMTEAKKLNSTDSVKRKK